jgi:hypothetical protein
LVAVDMIRVKKANIKSDRRMSLPPSGYVMPGLDPGIHPTSL